MRQHSPILRLAPVLLLHLIGFGIAIPVLPALAIDLGGTESDVGFLYAVQAIGQFMMAPVWGRFSDTYGRKNVFVTAIASAAVFEFLSAVAPTLTVLYATRFAVGLCAGNIAAASAYIADSTDEKDRSQGMALIGIGFGVGFTIGPAIGGAISLIERAGPGLWGSGLPFAVGGVLELIAAGLGLMLLEEPLDSSARRSKNRETLDFETVRYWLKRPAIWTMCGLFFVYTLASAILEGIFFLYANRVYGFAEWRVGLIFGGLGLLMATIQGGFVRKVSTAIGDRVMTGLGAALMGIGLVFAPMFEPLWYLLGFLVVATVGRAFVHPGAMAMTSQLAESPSETGQVMGILQSSNSLGRSIGPALGGVLFQYVGIGVPFWFAGGLLALGALVWWLTMSYLDET